MKKEFNEVHQDVAFPSIVETYNKIFYTKGLSKREYFAAMALQGLLANEKTVDIDISVAQLSVIAADALIEELNK